MQPNFPDEVIDYLGQCEWDPAAIIAGYEILSGSLYWSDERFLEFSRLCRSIGFRQGMVVFAFRTSLLAEDPFEPFRPWWEELLIRCPDWIGFRTERIVSTPELRARLQAEQDAV